MELKEFITAAISDISLAVLEADKAIKDLGGLVNPGTHRATGHNEDEFIAPRTSLNFDIAVSASKAKAGGAGAKMKILVVEANLGGEGELKNETVSRLTFSLDVVLPHDSSQAKRVGKVKTT